MSKDVKIWKPGQLVTIENKVYRIVKRKHGCAYCENVHTEPFNMPCVVCARHMYTGDKLLKELKPKQKV